MFKTWIEIFLGKIGQYIIDFIAGYYYFIIPPIIVYGIFLTLASYNLRRLGKQVNRIIIKQARDMMKENNQISFIDLVDHINISWGTIISQHSFFPYISQESDLWVSRTSRENVRNILMRDNARIRMVLERNGIFLLSPQPEVRKNLYKEFIHRITRRR
jgi:hypothetical protein